MNIFPNDFNNFNVEKAPQSFSHHCHGSILWNHHTKDHPETLLCARLSKLAEKKRWNPATDIDWNFSTANQQFPCIPDADPLVGFDEYEKLPLKTRCQISWLHHKMEISEILHGEQLAMLCASQLMTLMPCMESRLFASRQASDEARHVKFGTDYLAARFLHHDAEQLRKFGHYIVDKVFELASSDNHCVAIAIPFCWDIHKLRHHLRRQRINNPESIHQRFRQLSINIKAIGLMSPALEQRLNRFLLR